MYLIISMIQFTPTNFGFCALLNALLEKHLFGIYVALHCPTYLIGMYFQKAINQKLFQKII